MSSTAVDPALCPICGERNLCGSFDASAESLKDGALQCWCVDEEIPVTALNEIPGPLRGKACICQQCARRFQSASIGVQNYDPQRADSRRLRLGILNADNVREELSPEFGEYPEMFARVLEPAATSLNVSLELHSWNVHENEYPTDLECVDAFLITGSKYSVYDQEPWIVALGQFVERLHKAQKKLIGVCFGHQLVAHQLGGRTEKSAKGWAIGSHVATVSEGFATAAEGTQFCLLSSHQDQVVSLPPEARVVASTEFCPVSMMRLGRHILTVQSHPEFSSDYARKLYQLRQSSFTPDAYRTAQASLEGTQDRERVARWLLEFALEL